MPRPATSRTVTMVLVASTIAAHGAAAAGQGPSILSLNDAMARALEANRTILAARTARAIDLAGVQAAGQRPNPDVSFEYAKETPHWAFTGAMPLDLSGKRQRRLDVANATLAVTEAETARITTDVRAEVRRAYYMAVGATRRVANAQELEAIQSRARDAAQDRFQTGAAPRLEALQASLALAQAQNEVAVARGDLNAARADLNALLASGCRRSRRQRNRSSPATPSCKCSRNGSTRHVRASHSPKRCGVPIQR